MSSAIFSCVPALDLCSNVNYTNPELPSKIAIASSTISCLGSAAIIMSYVTVKEYRTGAQTIILLLAVADFLTSVGYIIGSVNFLNHWGKNATYDCGTFNATCQAQSFLTTWSSICSQAWTCILAAYFLYVLRWTSKLGARALVLSNVLVWGLPLVPVAALLGNGRLGYSITTAAGWCFIQDTSHNESRGLEIILTLVGGKLTEMVTYTIVVVVYVITLIHLWKMHGCGCKKISAEMRLLSIPLAYLGLRVWGTIHFFYTLHLFHKCIDANTIKVVKILVILQAIGDPGQGWCNAILYIFFSPIYRRKIIIAPLTALASCLVGIAACALQTCAKFSLNINSGGRIISEKTPLLEP